MNKGEGEGAHAVVAIEDVPTEIARAATAADAGRWLLSWEAAAAAGPSAAGGKGYHLALLALYGLPVPAGAVLSASAYRHCMESAGVQQLAAAVEATAAGADEEIVEERLADLRARVEAATVPEPLLGALREALAMPGLAGQPLAVRSSATAEDSALASFAGMHHTSLNVPPTLDDLAAAVRRCYASLWTPHALAYRRRLGIDGVQMAVVIVRLVPARAAGVAFSADPRNGRRDRFVITANLGLGESVVGGAADPDEYQVQIGLSERPKIVSSHIGRKERRTVLRDAPGGGTKLIETGRSDAPGLTDEQIQHLAVLVGRCYGTVGEDDMPQDVEWAHDGTRFWILQSRPITALPARLPAELQGQPIIWSTANVKEVLPPVQTPYGWSSTQLSSDHMMRAIVTRSGYDVPEGMQWMRRYEGHPYFNLSLIQWVVYDAFGSPPSATNRLLGGRQPEIAVPKGPPFTGRKGLARLRRMLWQMQDARRAFVEVPAACREIEAHSRRFLAQELSAMSDEEIEAHLWEIGREFSDFGVQFMRANSQATTWLDALPRLLEWLLPGRGTGLAARLLAGAGGIASAEQGYRLVEITRLAAQDERARRFFLEAQSIPHPALGDLGGTDGRAAERELAPDQPPVAEWRRCLEGTAAGEAFARFLEEFGHRGVDELELANPRWIEDPSYLVETVRQHILSGVEPRATADRAIRQAAEHELRRALRLHPLRLPALALVRWVLSQARRASALRENAKSALVLVILPVRHAAHELARRLVARGQLPSEDDFYFLTFWDIHALFLGLWDGSGTDRLVADRRARYVRQLRTRVPDVLIEDTAAGPATRPATAAHQAVPLSSGDATGGNVLPGLAVAAGVARGPARVIQHPRAGHRLHKGDILVAPTTDPGWTPLFLRAAGLVMETGGYLSHGAIVAREYGIPAVANVAGVLDVVRDGETLVVDGERGQVVRMATSDE
ncbi:MAG: hypothetical protein HY332_19735 [Chloroflexi bacterium]|nr:hypothetical protein [Chloroflexota bacterium]